MIIKCKKHFSEIKKSLYLKDYKYLKYYINTLPDHKKDSSYLEFLYIILNINSNSFKRKVSNEIMLEYNELKEHKENDIKFETLIEGKEYFRVGIHKNSQEYKLLFDYFLSNTSTYKYKCLFFYHVNIFKDYSLVLSQHSNSKINRLSNLNEYNSEYELDMSSSSIEYILKKVLYKITITTNNTNNTINTNEEEEEEEEDIASINKETTQVLNILNNNNHISNLDTNEIYIISLIYRLINKYYIDLISKVILNKSSVDYMTLHMNIKDHLYLSLSNKKRIIHKKYIYKFYSTEILYENIRNLKETFEKKHLSVGENSQKNGNIFKIYKSKNEIFDYVFKYIPLLFNQNKDYKLIYNIVKNMLLLNQKENHIENKKIIEDLISNLLINNIFLYENYTFNQYFYYLKLVKYLISYKDSIGTKNISIIDINYEVINRLLSLMSIILESPFENTSFSLYENVILLEKIVSLLEILFNTSQIQLLSKQSKVKYSILIEINQKLEKYDREIYSLKEKEAYLVSKYKRIAGIYKEILLKIRLSFVLNAV